MERKFTHFFIFGDSITYGAWDKDGGWASRLRKFVDKKNISDTNFYCLVYNLGISGDTTTDVLERFEFELKMRLQDETVVVFAIGINDSAFLNDKQTNYVSFEQFKTNLQSLIVLAQKFTSKIVFVGLSHVDEAKTAPVIWDTSKSYKNKYIQQYDASIKHFAQQNSLLFIDVFNKLSRTNYKSLTNDGLHPNAKGHKIIFGLVKHALIKQGIISK